MELLGCSKFRKRQSPLGKREQKEKRGDSGNGSPRRWGWGIPLKKTIRHPNRKDSFQMGSILSTGKSKKSKGDVTESSNLSCACLAGFNSRKLRRIRGRNRVCGRLFRSLAPQEFS
jgi:hypothetical protein